MTLTFSMVVYIFSFDLNEFISVYMNLKMNYCENCWKNLSQHMYFELQYKLLKYFYYFTEVQAENTEG